MQLSIRRFMGSDGERFALLVDAEGMPLYYQNLFATSQMRGASLAVNTIVGALTSLKAVQAWAEHYGIDLESRFARSELLLPREVTSLRDFMQKPLESLSPRKVVPLRGARPKIVDKGNQYNRMSTAASYLGFLASTVHPNTPTSAAKIEKMVDLIKANRPGRSDKGAEDRDEIHLDDENLDRIEELLTPGGGANPFKGFDVQLRNALMFQLVRLTGIRRGELLNIKIEDLNFAKNQLRVTRRADSAGDIRAYQPVAKTRERTFPLMPELMIKIHDYIVRYRSKTKSAKSHGYVFVTHKVGVHSGKPLSNSAFGKFMEAIREASVSFSGIHLHALRHHWNFTFSAKSDDKQYTPEREEKIRSYLMGWKPTSGMAAVYNKRHIKQEAGEATLSLQSKYLNKGKG